MEGAASAQSSCAACGRAAGLGGSKESSQKPAGACTQKQSMSTAGELEWELSGSRGCWQSREKALYAGRQGCCAAEVLGLGMLLSSASCPLYGARQLLQRACWACTGMTAGRPAVGLEAQGAHHGTVSSTAPPFCAHPHRACPRPPPTRCSRCSLPSSPASRRWAGWGWALGWSVWASAARVSPAGWLHKQRPSWLARAWVCEWSLCSAGWPGHTHAGHRLVSFCCYSHASGHLQLLCAMAVHVWLAVCWPRVPLNPCTNGLHPST